MNIIKLSTYIQSDSYRKSEDIYINADLITAFKPCTNVYYEFLYTQIDTVGGASYKVKESPSAINDILNRPYPTHY